MPAPQPLTACDPPQLDWSRPGTPAAVDFGDIYFSTDGGLAETEAVYLRACGLPERWQARSNFTIGELGFGTGLNFLAAWRMWDRAKPAGGRLEFVSVEKFPFDRDQLIRALAAWPELSAYTKALTALWPGRVKGVHRLHVAPGVTLILIHDDVLSGLQSVNAKVDAWFLDGFSPVKNPDMWSPDVMRQIARLSAQGARIGTFTAAGSVRQALSDAGFAVSKTEGFGRKRHRLEAVFPGQRQEPAHDIRPIIVGAGIAGASLAKSFLRRGITPVVIDPDDGTMGSGNPAAIIKPRIDLQDKPESRFYLSSYLYALAQYSAVESGEAGAVFHEGIRHVAKTPDEVRRYAKFHAQGALPEPHIMPTDDGVYFGKAVVVNPEVVRRAWLSGAFRIKSSASEWEITETGVRVFSASGKVLAEGTHIIVAAGFGVKALGLGVPLDLRYSRGQLTWAKPVDGFDKPLTYGGYGLPLAGGVLTGTTHQRAVMEDPFSLVVDDDDSNLSRLSERLGRPVLQAQKPSRASVRVNSKTTQPIIAAPSPRCRVVTGLGSRGFVFAPLLAEDMVSSLCGGVSTGEFVVTDMYGHSKA